jgi:hypothetical protein
MDLPTAALIAAGLIGALTAVVHGVLTQRLMVQPAGAAYGGALRRLVPMLLHFSTFNWLIGGAALIAAALWAGPEARRWTGLLVASSYLFAAAGNLWGTRTFHPGWILMSAALMLIAYGLS